MIKACTEWLVATVGYWIRPYDMLADRLRWRWQEPQRCGLPDGIRLVGIDDDGEAHYVSVELANAEAKADILTGGRWVVEYGTSDAAGGFWPNSRKPSGWTRTPPNAACGADPSSRSRNPPGSILSAPASASPQTTRTSPDGHAGPLKRMP